MAADTLQSIDGVQVEGRNIEFISELLTGNEGTTPRSTTMTQGPCPEPPLSLPGSVCELVLHRGSGPVAVPLSRALPPSGPDRELLASVVDVLDLAEQAEYEEALRAAVRPPPPRIPPRSKSACSLHKAPFCSAPLDTVPFLERRHGRTHPRSCPRPPCRA